MPDIRRTLFDQRNLRACYNGVDAFTLGYALATGEGVAHVIICMCLILKDNLSLRGKCNVYT